MNPSFLLLHLHIRGSRDGDAWGWVLENSGPTAQNKGGLHSADTCSLRSEGQGVCSPVYMVTPDFKVSEVCECFFTKELWPGSFKYPAILIHFKMELTGLPWWRSG